MDQKSKWRLHLRHSVIVVTVFSLIILICAAIWFGTYKMPTTLAYLTPSKVSQRISVSSQSMATINSQSASEAGSQISSVSSSTGPAYQQSYPNLYVPSVEKTPKKAGDKVVYLTFDDGPSELTEPLLNILDKYDVKATFFVMAQGKSKENCAAWMNDIVHRGHALALHTYTHDYRQIYASPQAFLDDFARMSDFIEQSTGEKVTMFRFPGGSVNGYNKLTGKAIRDEMTRRGYTYYDWNVSSGDAANAPLSGNIYHNVIRGVHKYNTSIVLMHNSAAKRATLSQVSNIITTLKNEGYRFDKLDPSVKPVDFVAPGD